MSRKCEPVPSRGAQQLARQHTREQRARARLCDQRACMSPHVRDDDHLLQTTLSTVVLIAHALIIYFEACRDEPSAI